MFSPKGKRDNNTMSIAHVCCCLNKCKTMTRHTCRWALKLMCQRSSLAFFWVMTEEEASHPELFAPHRSVPIDYKGDGLFTEIFLMNGRHREHSIELLEPLCEIQSISSSSIGSKDYLTNKKLKKDTKQLAKSKKDYKILLLQRDGLHREAGEWWSWRWWHRLCYTILVFLCE